MTALEQFIAKHERRFTIEPNSGCWLWTAARTTAGYGECDGQYAHRASFIAAHGAIPTDRPIIRHRCDTPACINPDHLVCGTKRDNSRDMVARGRNKTKRGSECHKAVLNESSVVLIREAVADGVPFTELSRRYFVTVETIRQAVWGTHWKHVGGPTRAPRRRLCGAQVIEIRTLLGTTTQKEIATRFGIKQVTVSAIKTGRLWGNVA